MAIVTNARQAAFEKIIQSLDSAARMIESDGVLSGAIENGISNLTLELHEAHNGSEIAPLRACFEAGRLAMAFDILAGDALPADVKSSSKASREMLRFYREWFRELPARIDLAAIATDAVCPS